MPGSCKKLLPIERDKLPVEILQAIDLTTIRSSINRPLMIKVTPGSGELPIEKPSVPQIQVDEKEVLSKIIEELNEKFGTEWED